MRFHSMPTQNETRRMRQYRKMARQMRKMAADFVDSEARISMLVMAEAYEHMAAQLASRAPRASLIVRNLMRESDRNTTKRAHSRA
jgi:hypothetical protein